jgi:hypothetical protein
MAWAPDYTTDEVLKDYLGITIDADDAFVPMWITTSSRNVDDFCGRQFGQVATLETRRYRGVWDASLGAYVYQIDDLLDVTGFLVDGVTDYDLEPMNAPQKGRPYERLVTRNRGPLDMDGLWGWPAESAAAASVEMGMLLQASRLHARRDSPFGVAGSPSEGNAVRLLAQLDPDFRTSLKPFRRKWYAA